MLCWDSTSRLLHHPCQSAAAVFRNPWRDADTPRASCHSAETCRQGCLAHHSAGLPGCQTKTPTEKPMRLLFGRQRRWQMSTQRTLSRFALPRSSIFFPSCASVALARSSHIVVLMNELSRCNCNVPHWGVESGVGTITQSEVKSGPKHRENQKTTKAKTTQKQKTNQTTQTAKRALTSQLQ